MATITFNGESFDVDHAVKGSDYVHGYDVNGICVFALDGVTDFSGITYDGIYMDPRDCMAEACNNVKYCGGELKTADGEKVNLGLIETWTNSNAYNGYSSGTVEFSGEAAFFVVSYLVDVEYIRFPVPKSIVVIPGANMNITEETSEYNEDHTSTSRAILATTNSIYFAESPEGSLYMVPYSVCAVKL